MRSWFECHGRGRFTCARVPARLLASQKLTGGRRTGSSVLPSCCCARGPAVATLNPSSRRSHSSLTRPSTGQTRSSRSCRWHAIGAPLRPQPRHLAGVACISAPVARLGLRAGRILRGERARSEGADPRALRGGAPGCRGAGARGRLLPRGPVPVGDRVRHLPRLRLRSSRRQVCEPATRRAGRLEGGSSEGGPDCRRPPAHRRIAAP